MLERAPDGTSAPPGLRSRPANPTAHAVNQPRRSRSGAATDHPHIQHSNLGITSVYLQVIDNAEIINTVQARRAPMIPVSTALRL